ncbi:MAG: hypothetical protein EAY68_10665 [Bacteroidetes bacterium]|nr:MAG: hypothetical protein EAY68_10665 [Bacteroidota bacterium]
MVQPEPPDEHPVNPTQYQLKLPSPATVTVFWLGIKALLSPLYSFTIAPVNEVGLAPAPVQTDLFPFENINNAEFNCGG